MKVVWLDTLVDYPIYGVLSDSPLFNSSYDISLPLAYVYLRTFIKTARPDYTFTYVPRRLLKAEGCLDNVESYISEADVVATSCSTADSPDAEEILRAAKALGKATIVGGIFPRFSSARVMKWDCVDYCVTGEGETPFLQVLDHIAGRYVPSKMWAGVCTRENPKYVRAPLCDLATLPDPDYSDLPMGGFKKYMNSAYMLATRGCPAPCHFCTSARLYGYSYRKRPIPSVLNEIRALRSCGFSAITLADDTIAADRAWAKLLFESLFRENLGVRLKVRARADELDEEMVELMAAANVSVIQFGIESINLTTRESMHKKLDQDAIDRAFELIFRQPGMKANALYMLAYPGETETDLSSNASFIKAVGSDSRVITYVSFTTPYPDTPFSVLCERGRGLLLTSHLKYFTNKFPVFIPESLNYKGPQSALQTLVENYNSIAAVVNKSHLTQQPIPEEFFHDVEFAGATLD